MPLAAPVTYRYTGGTPGQPTSEHASLNVTYLGNQPIYGDNNGNIAMRPNTTTGTVSQARQAFANNSKFAQFRGLWTPVTAPSAATTPFIFRSNASPMLDLLWNTNGTAAVRTITNSATTFAATLGTTFLVEAAADLGSTSTNGRNMARITNVSTGAVVWEQSSTTKDYSAHSTTLYAVWGKGASAGTTQDMFWDDVVVWDGAYEYLTAPSDAPIVNAGQDQANILPYQMVTLSGSSTGAAPTSWNWTQVAGPMVTLSGTGASRTFVAPAMPDDTTLRFSLTANNGAVQSAADTVDIFVQNHNNFKAIGGTWTGIRLNRLSN